MANYTYRDELKSRYGSIFDALKKEGEEKEAAKKQSEGKLKVSQPGDAHETEAEQLAAEATNSKETKQAMQSGPEMAAGPGFKKQVEALEGKGKVLDEAIKTDMEQKLDADFSKVKIHDDAQAAQLAEQINAKAFTLGQDIFFAEGQYQPETEEGKHLLAHELAHTMQQKFGLNRMVMRFEAPGHEAVGRTALTLGGKMTNDEASMIYFGNWMRDMNQVLVPATKDLGSDVLFSLISFLAMKKFGRSLTPEQFGYYIPAEHIDSPAGQVAGYDYYNVAPTIGSAGQLGADRFNTTGQKPKDPAHTTPQQSTAPAAQIDNKIPGKIFEVDETGVIGYLRRTNLHVEKRLELAAIKGRNPEGFLHFGAAMHAVEDLFAHSNFVEIALNILLKEDNKLLPELKKEERNVQTLSSKVNVKGSERDVLITGSFTGADTLISVGSEAVKMLREGLGPVASKQETAAQEAFMGQLLKAIDSQSESNPNIKSGVINILIDWGIPEFIANNIITSYSLYDIYFTLQQILSLLSFYIPIDLTAIKNSIRQLISEQLFLPLANQIEARALESKARDTSLLRAKEDYAKTIASRGKTQGGLKESMGGIVGADTEAMARENLKDAVAHKTALDATPQKVLAGPSHSQLSKDHGDSVFYGLAFKLAVEADKLLRDKMLIAWGKQTVFTDTDAKLLNKNDKDLNQDQKERKQMAGERSIKDNESLNTGKNIVATGHDQHISPDKYNLQKMRNDSARRLNMVASGLDSLANAPKSASKNLAYLRGLLNAADKENEMGAIKDNLNTLLSKSQKLATKADDRLAKMELNKIAADFKAASFMVSQAQSHKDREAAYNLLMQSRNNYISWLGNNSQNGASQYSKVQFAIYATLFTAMEREIAVAAPSYSSQQVEILTSKGNGLALNDKIDLPAIENKNPSINDLLQTSRRVIAHPAENAWWKQHVIDFIKQHGKQLAEEIRARNAGYLKFRE